MRKEREIKVRCWVPDASCPGGYRPWDSLRDEAKRERGHLYRLSMEKALKEHYTAHPEALARP